MAMRLTQPGKCPLLSQQLRCKSVLSDIAEFPVNIIAEHSTQQGQGRGGEPPGKVRALLEYSKVIGETIWHISNNSRTFPA